MYNSDLDTKYKAPLAPGDINPAAANVKPPFLEVYTHLLVTSAVWNYEDKAG